MTTKIAKFDDTEYAFLSNFYPCKVVHFGLTFPTSEHAYVAAKTKDEEERLKISKIPTAAKVKKYGRSLKLRDDWEEVKIREMRDIVFAKFHQNVELGQKLIDTGDATLEEGNWWGDKFWGISPAESGNGENNLGKVLMWTRDLLKRFQELEKEEGDERD